CQNPKSSANVSLTKTRRRSTKKVLCGAEWRTWSFNQIRSREIFLRTRPTLKAMAKTVVIDSGAIVAALRQRDQHHAWARAHFEAETEAFVTCEAVLSESFFLLEKAPGGKEALCGLLER